MPRARQRGSAGWAAVSAFRACSAASDTDGGVIYADGDEQAIKQFDEAMAEEMKGYDAWRDVYEHAGRRYRVTLSRGTRSVAERTGRIPQGPGGG